MAVEEAKGVLKMYQMPQLRLGAVTDQGQAQLLVDLGTQVVAPLNSATDKMPDVAKYEPDLYRELAPELQTLFNASNALELEINRIPLPVSADTEKVIAKKIETLSKLVEGFGLRVVSAARVGVEQKQLRTAALSVTIGAAVVGLGWWLAKKAPGLKGRRRRRR